MDERGYCRIEGRVKEVIIRGGENIYPREIEQLLFSHPGVADVAVVGAPDDYWGEEVAAFVRPAAGQSPREEELLAYCRQHLAAHKMPRRWIFVIGQGLSLAMRDVRILSELLVSSSDWSPQVLEPYALERAERMTRVRAAAVAVASLFSTYTAEAANRRRAFRERTATDRTLALPLIALYAGPETAPSEAFTPSSLELLVGASVALDERLV